ncbi:MAG: phosphotransferase [Gammaproteobacteria bacterium]|nr:phosphotransferase [Gammaproteobacteria bacterium]
MTQGRVPDFTHNAVGQLVREHYSRSGELQALQAWCDLNFLLTSNTGEHSIVKIGGGSESFEALCAQNAAMTRLANDGFPVPRAIRNLDGVDVTRVRDQQGRECYLRLLTYLPGCFYADIPVRKQTPALWQSLGSLLGRLNVAMADLEPGDTDHYRLWDLANGEATCESRKQALDDGQRALVDYFLGYYRNHVLPLTGDMPRSVIHNDANDHNLLVDDSNNPQAIAGLIDFGDMVYSHTVNDLAIAAAYALMGQPEPLDTLQHLVSNYHAERPLNEAEVEALYGLIALRLCTSVCNASTEFAARPDNDYLLISAAPAWDLLGKLRELSPDAVAHRLRHACDMPACRGTSQE